MTQQTSTVITYSKTVSYINGCISFCTIIFVNVWHLHLMILLNALTMVQQCRTMLEIQ